LRYDGDDHQDRTDEIPVVSPDDSRVTITGAEVAAEAADESSIMPHWTEAPTGQVPTVLSRDASPNDDDPWASIPAPAWREGEADWVAHDEAFEPAMLTGDVPATSESASLDVDYADAVDEIPDSEVLAATPRPSRTNRTRRTTTDNPLAGRAARAKTKNVSLATTTGVAVAVVVFICLLWGTVPMMVVICLALLVATAEAYAAFRAVGVHPATLLGLVAVLALAIAAYNKGEVAVGLVSVLFFFFAVLWYMGAERKVDVLDGIGSTVFVYVWLGIFGSFAALLISPVDYPHRHGLAFLFGAIFVTVANDVAALFVGQYLGKRPLAKNISPGKTVEGFIGGAVVSIVLAYAILPLVHPWTHSSALVVGIALAVVTPIGDLFESMVKRSLGIKDMGELLPGHGGMLDRVDGLLFALPTTFYLVHAFHLG
jgi:phosphatidate cytidylyltransferase